MDKSNKTIWHQQTAVITLFATTFYCLIPFSSASLFWNFTLTFIRNFSLPIAIHVSEIFFGKKTRAKERKKSGKESFRKFPLISTTTSMMTRAGSKFPLVVRKQNRKSTIETFPHHPLSKNKIQKQTLNYLCSNIKAELLTLSNFFFLPQFYLVINLHFDWEAQWYLQNIWICFLIHFYWSVLKVKVLPLSLIY